MFIEVTSNHEKYLINPDHILMVSPIDDWVDCGKAIITFSHPITLGGSSKLVVKKPYEELKKLLK